MYLFDLDYIMIFFPTPVCVKGKKLRNKDNRKKARAEKREFCPTSSIYSSGHPSVGLETEYMPGNSLMCKIHFLKLEARDILIEFPPMRMIGFSTNIFLATSRGTQTNAELPTNFGPS